MHHAPPFCLLASGESLLGIPPMCRCCAEKREPTGPRGITAGQSDIYPPTDVFAGQRVGLLPGAGFADVCWRDGDVCWRLLGDGRCCMDMHESCMDCVGAVGFTGVGACRAVRRRWSCVCGVVRTGIACCRGRSGRRPRRGARRGRRGRPGVGSRAIRTWGGRVGMRPWRWPCGGRRVRRGGCCLPMRGCRCSGVRGVLVCRSGRMRGAVR